MTEMEMEYLVSRYADNTLSEPERKKARQLIKCNPDCRRWLAEHRQLREVLDDWSNRLPMLDWNAFDAALAQRIDKKIKAGENHILHVRQWLGAVAVAGLIALLGATIWLTHPPARKDIPSYAQPPRGVATGPKFATRSAATAALKQPHIGKPAAVIKSVNQVSSHPSPKPSRALASKVRQASLPPLDRGYGVAPPTGASRHLTGVADAPDDSLKSAASPR
jgi:hypothetical protein